MLPRVKYKGLSNLILLFRDRSDRAEPVNVVDTCFPNGV